MYSSPCVAVLFSIIDPSIATKPGRSTLGFCLPNIICLQQGEGGVGGRRERGWEGGKEGGGGRGGLGPGVTLAVDPSRRPSALFSCRDGDNSFAFLEQFTTLVHINSMLFADRQA